MSNETTIDGWMVEYNPATFAFSATGATVGQGQGDSEGDRWASTLRKLDAYAVEVAAEHGLAPAGASDSWERIYDDGTVRIDPPLADGLIHLTRYLGWPSEAEVARSTTPIPAEWL